MRVSDETAFTSFTMLAQNWEFIFLEDSLHSYIYKLKIIMVMIPFNYSLVVEKPRLSGLTRDQLSASSYLKTRLAPPLTSSSMKIPSAGGL